MTGWIPLALSWLIADAPTSSLDAARRELDVARARLGERLDELARPAGADQLIASYVAVVAAGMSAKF